MQIAVERRSAHSHASGHFGDSETLGEESLQALVTAVKFVVTSQRTARPAQRTPLGPQACQCLACTLADEITFDLGTQSKGKGQYFAADVVAQAIVVFDGVQATAARHAHGEYLHNHEQASSQPRQLGTHDKVVSAHATQQASQRTLAVILRAADGLLYPAIHMQPLPAAIVLYLKALILRVLFVRRDSDISIRH